MIKLNAFTTDIHAQYDFLKGGAIERLMKDIKKEDLTDHPVENVRTVARARLAMRNGE